MSSLFSRQVQHCRNEKVKYLFVEELYHYSVVRQEAGTSRDSWTPRPQPPHAHFKQGPRQSCPINPEMEHRKCARA